jgi:hypothetical protein
MPGRAFNIMGNVSRTGKNQDEGKTDALETSPRTPPPKVNVGNVSSEASPAVSSHPEFPVSSASRMWPSLVYRH